MEGAGLQDDRLLISEDLVAKLNIEVGSDVNVSTPLSTQMLMVSGVNRER